MTMRLLIVGGSDAGISAALRARELDPNAEITVLLADDFPNYSICGLPFYLSGEAPDWKSLAHRTQFDGITVCRGQEANHINISEKTVSATERGRKVITHGYEKLVIATGASPVTPPIAGLDLPGVFPLHTMKDSFAMNEFIASARPRRAVIVGAGYIGLEMADALTHRGIEVTVASRTPSVLPTVEPNLGEAVAAELERNHVIVRTDVEAHAVSRAGDHLHVSGSAGFEQDCEMVLIAVGVKPNTRLGLEAGIQTGTKGALQVNRRMETAIPDIYAAGDCVETWHRLLHRYTYLPLGTTAHKQGRCAGENAVGGHRDFAGSMGTQVVKIFDLVVARAGLRQDEAVREGYSAYTTETTSFDHKAYYPGAKQLRIRVTGDGQTGRLLGAQVLGSFGAEISKRVDIFATALFHGMAVEELGDLDLSYTPPLSSPWDPVQMAAHHWAAALRSEQMEAMCRK
jgi:NADPH-dependent 2,4-dienoyl-CoA reductase/sulfur reductase-like enzyme